MSESTKSPQHNVRSMAASQTLIVKMSLSPHIQPSLDICLLAANTPWCRTTVLTLLLQLTADLTDSCLDLHRSEEWAAVEPGYPGLSSCAHGNLSEHRTLTQARMYNGMQVLTSQVIRWMPATALQGSEARSCFCFKLRQIDCDSRSDEIVDQPVQCNFLERRACQDGTARVGHSTIVSSQGAERISQLVEELQTLETNRPTCGTGLLALPLAWLTSHTDMSLSHPVFVAVL